MSDINFNVTVNTNAAKNELNALDMKKEITEESIDQSVMQSEQQLDLVFAKAIMTVQRIQSLTTQALRIGGLALGRVGQSVMSTVSLAAATLGPLFAAQQLSGWQSIQATMGLIELSIALTTLPLLIQDVERNEGMEAAFIKQSNASIGRQNY